MIFEGNQELPSGEGTARYDTAAPRSEAPAQSDLITSWAQAWTDFFSSDTEAVEKEVHVLCNKIRSTLKTIEGQTPPP
jgi:hypothetical protein